MAQIDRSLTFEAKKALANATTFKDHINLGGKDRRLGIGSPLHFVIDINTALDNTSGNETYTFILEQSDSATFASGVTEVCRIEIAAGTNATGTDYTGRLVQGVGYALKGQYVRARATMAGTSPSGTVTAYVHFGYPQPTPADQIYPAEG